MARSGFLVENEYRAYPFVDAGAGVPLPEDAVVDFGCLMGLDAGHVDGVDAVRLHRVTRAGGAVRFEFRAAAAGAADYPLAFVVPEDAAEFETFEAEADLAPGSAGSSTSSACGDAPVWEGFLVVGRLAALLDLLAEGESLDGDAGVAVVEPARVTNLARTYVRGVNLANADRVRADDPAGCSAFAPDEPGRVYVGARCLGGDLELAEGYNCSIRQAADGTVTIGAGVGAGAGEPCEEVPVRAGEAAPDGGRLLTGGPTCGEVLKSINGVGGKIIRVTPGPGVRITPGASPGQLLVDVDLHGLAVCRTSSITV